MSKVFEQLIAIGKEKAKNLPPEVLILRGLWRTDYVLQLTENSTRFHLHYILAQTKGIGCSYYELTDEEPGLSPSLIGKNVFEINNESKCIRIAALDAVFASINDTPSQRIVINGTNIEKDDKRAEVVCNEIFSILRNKKPKNGKNMIVLNVGVVGTFIKKLKDSKKIEVKATDRDSRVVGKLLHGVKVEYGEQTIGLLEKADLAIITGMTLANDTIDDILSTSIKEKTALVIFAETGANFASEYCKMGVDVVIGEPFPFYLSCAGDTILNIYRRMQIQD